MTLWVFFYTVCMCVRERKTETEKERVAQPLYGLWGMFEHCSMSYI